MFVGEANSALTYENPYLTAVKSCITLATDGTAYFATSVSYTNEMFIKLPLVDNTTEDFIHSELKKAFHFFNFSSHRSLCFFVSIGM
jgi:hypothetical protein